MIGAIVLSWLVTLPCATIAASTTYWLATRIS
jgi:phosphate/sulfate permease